LNTQIAAGNSPDIIGPVGVAGRAAFTDALLDLQPLIDATNYDLSDFDQAMVDFYDLEGRGQVGLPFGIFPSFIFFNKELFDEAGLNYPPQEYGVPYVLDGEEMPWDMNTVAELGRILTVDENGNDATMAEFDPEAIVQFGYGVQWADVRGKFTLFEANAFHDGNGNAVIPDAWAEAAQWYYDAMWNNDNGVFMPNGIYGGSDILGAGDYFVSGNIAMDHVHLWYATCCTAGLEDAWDIAVMPAAPDGTITAKMHADTFAILEGSEHPEAAFEVLSYLIGEAADPLTQLYGGLPARLSLQGSYFDALDSTDNFAGKDITWSVAVDSMAYPDNPNHEEGYPGELEVRDALAVFDEQMNNNPDFDVEAGLEELRLAIQDIIDAQ
jgi:multiple sugar transport system substrate-binding protein